MKRRLVEIALLGLLLSAGLVLQAQTTPKQKPKLPPRTAPTQTPAPTQPVKPINPLLLPRPKPGEVQRPELPDIAEEPKSKDDPYLYPWGRLATRRTTPQGVILTLEGDAQLLYKDSKFLSDNVLYNQDTEIASAPTKVKLDDAQNTITGDRGTAYYGKNKKEAILEGNVTIIARPKQNESGDPKSLRKEFKSPVTITCDRANYKWKDRHGWSNTNVRVVGRVQEKDWDVVAEQMDYYGKEEKIVLTGKVYAKNNKGEEVYLDKATFFFTEGAEKFDGGKVKGGTKILVPDDDDDKPKPPDDKTKPTDDKAKPGDGKPKVDETGKKPGDSGAKPSSDTDEPTRVGRGARSARVKRGVA